jgi:hypothetical protein
VFTRLIIYGTLELSSDDTLFTNWELKQLIHLTGDIYMSTTAKKAMKKPLTISVTEEEKALIVELAYQARSNVSRLALKQLLPKGLETTLEDLKK